MTDLSPSEPYTPTTTEVATAWRDSRCDGDGDHTPGCPAVDEFDRWLASVRAAALDEAAEVATAGVYLEVATAYESGWNDHGFAIASAIRALKEEKK